MKESGLLFYDVRRNIYNTLTRRRPAGINCVSGFALEMFLMSTCAYPKDAACALCYPLSLATQCPTLFFHHILRINVVSEKAFE
jgi:hypothetical protein